MDYQKHYNNLIIRANNGVLNDYTKSHYIIPKCISGLDINEDLVIVTHEEQKKKISEIKRLNKMAELGGSI